MKNTLKIGHKIIILNEPIIMGILNVTPDSFYKGSRLNPKHEEFLQKAAQMVVDGAKILDVGGFSTRPGGDSISTKEEISRVIPAIVQLKKQIPNIPISIDTFKAEVARIAIDEGAEIVNDISGGDFDKKMASLIIEKNPVYIMMHLEGSISSMHSKTNYRDLLPEIANKLFTKANILRKQGVKDIILDPGIGFSKSVQQNYTLLENLQIFNTGIYPLLVGVSRKSLIYKTLDISPEEALPYSIQLASYSIAKGAKILRVHDVKETMNMLTIHNHFTTK